MNINEKAAYIKGLAEGLKLDCDTAEGKILTALIDLVTEITSTLQEVDESLDYLNDYIEEVDEDLGAVEECLLDDEACSCGCDCDCDDEDDDEDEYYEVECPSCGEKICFDSSVDPEELVCPACNEKIECIIDEEDLKAIDGE